MSLGHENNKTYITTESAKIVFYADDSTLYYAAPSCSELNDVLNKELQVLQDWISCNKLVLNIPKTKSILIGSRHKLFRSPKLDLKLNNVTVEQVNSIKLLGVMLDSRLSFSNHINQIILKKGRVVGISRKCASFVARPLLCQIVQSLVLCHLEYCSVVLASAAKGELRKLQIAQNKAARLVLGCSTRSNINRMHDSLSWLTVENRLALNTTVMFKSVLISKTPHFLFNQIIFRSSVHNHSTRGSSKGQLEVPHPRTNALSRSFIYRAITLWNNLPHYLCCTESKQVFKMKLKCYYKCGLAVHCTLIK